MGPGFITQRFASRMELMARLNVGFNIKSEDGGYQAAKLLFRDPALQMYDNYLNNLQYQSLPPWSEDVLRTMHATDSGARQYQPRVIYALPKIAANVHTSHFVSEEARLKLFVDDVKLQEKLDVFIEDLQLWPTLAAAIPSYIVNGSMFLGFRLSQQGKVILNFYNTKWVYPKFDENEELEEVVIRYVYETDEYNSRGVKIWRWHQYKMSKENDIIYDEPEFDPQSTMLPLFKVSNAYNHNLGFVQGAWIKTSKTPMGHDGVQLLTDCLDMLDNVNYLLSKQGVAIDYQLLPYLIFQGDGEGVAEDIQKNMQLTVPRGFLGSNVITTGVPADKAQMHFLESSFVASRESTEYVRQQVKHLQTVLRIIEVDPEQVAGFAAQSGIALRMLFKPVIEFVRLKHPFVKAGICDLLAKIEHVVNRAKTSLELPAGTIENAEKKWGSVFSDTASDIATRISYTSSALMAGMISKETAVKHISQDFKVDNVAEELNKISFDEEERVQKEVNVMPGAPESEDENPQT